MEVFSLTKDTSPQNLVPPRRVGNRGFGYIVFKILNIRPAHPICKKVRAGYTFEINIGRRLPLRRPIWSRVLTPRDRMFTGEVNSSDYAHCVRKCNVCFGGGIILEMRRDSEKKPKNFRLSGHRSELVSRLSPSRRRSCNRPLRLG